MSDEPLTNAAVEFMRGGYALLSAADGPPSATDLQESLSADFSYSGRNRVGVNFGEMTSSDWPAFIASFWEIAPGRLQWSEPLAIAVRGQRCAVITASIGYGNDTFTDFIHCIRLDPTLQRLQRIVSFDVDDRDAAIAEVDRMYAEIDD
jgi:hypothetical protein